MVSLLVLGALVFAGLVVFGVLAAVAGLVGFVISLPFRVLGLVFRMLGLLIALPFVLLACVLGFGFAVLPLAPVIGVAWLVWWLLRDRGRPRSQASVVS